MEEEFLTEEFARSLNERAWDTRNEICRKLNMVIAPSMLDELLRFFANVPEKYRGTIPENIITGQTPLLFWNLNIDANLAIMGERINTHSFNVKFTFQYLNRKTWWSPNYHATDLGIAIAELRKRSLLSNEVLERVFRDALGVLMSLENDLLQSITAFLTQKYGKDIAYLFERACQYSDKNLVFHRSLLRLDKHKTDLEEVERGLERTRQFIKSKIIRGWREKLRKAIDDLEVTMEFIREIH